MKGIKYALTFLFGALYAITIHQLIVIPVSFQETNFDIFSFISFFIVVAISITIIGITISYLVENWDEE